MSTKLLPKNGNQIKWRFPEDVKDDSAVTFHIKLRSNRDRIVSNMKKSGNLIKTADDFALDCYGENIVKIENADGKTLNKEKDIVEFCLDRLSEDQGASLQLAIQNHKGFVDSGLVKN